MNFTTKGPASYQAGGVVKNKALVVRTANQDEVVEASNASPARGFVGIAMLAADTALQGETITVEPLTPEATLWAIASGNIAVGAKVYAAAAGKISSTLVAGAFLGFAEEAGVDGQIIVFRPAAAITAADLA